MRVRIATLPTIEPLTVLEARQHLNLTHTEDDELLAAYIEAARSVVERATHRALLTQVWEVHLDAFPVHNGSDLFPTALRLPGGHCQAVTAVTYVDGAGETQTLDAARYQADTSNEQGGVLVPAPGGSWPSTQAGRRSAVTVTQTVGWPDVRSIPPMLMHAVRFLIGHYYEHREAVVTGAVRELPQGAQSILAAWRVWGEHE